MSSSSKSVVCITTTKPSSSVTPSGGGGSLTVLCPQTGSILSSLRASADLSGKSALGMSSLSPFPESFNPSSSRLVLSFGGNSTRKSDTYAMMLAIRSSTSSPILHWKCRLPEAELTGGMVVSPCGHYIIGGGASGSCFVWSAVGGTLLKTFKAHYRACTCLSFSQCGKYVITGGADGMLHLFPFVDLVDTYSRKSKRASVPLQTWSAHHFPVTCLAVLDGDRVASAAKDGHVAIVELFSNATLAKIKLPNPVESLCHHDSRLYAGSDRGTIYSIDLNAYAMNLTEAQGARLSKRVRREREAFLVNEEAIFGKKMQDDSESLNAYQTEWTGHEHAVSSLAVFVDDAKQFLISGDRLGEVRIWDIESRTSLHTIRPWSNSAMNAAKSATQEKLSSESQHHPITSILVMQQPAESEASGMFSTLAYSGTKGRSGVSDLFPPLQKYPENISTDGDDLSQTAIPFLRPRKGDVGRQRLESRTLRRKRRPIPMEMSKEHENSDRLQKANDQIARLQEELRRKGDEVKRWQTVNNTIVKKLKAKR
ncbi:unnamed protein product [Cylindrotheca closterium]|uniref:WD repeat-containing protein 18 n=1 Tax=Cylindrotheca closterium TaxID=2856 RepID=A0AAD2PXP5_9STRA|nr:unnamed protein product [Cylindrotheca closterium]